MRAFLNTRLGAFFALSAAVFPQETDAMIQCGVASWYGLEAGTQRADGGSVDGGALSAAHRSLPFGTKVKVENLANGHEVTVEINDRGPFTNARVLDVSRRTAEELGFIENGLARVRVTTLDKGIELEEEVAATAKRCP
jgi:rare lipoprotein A